VLLLLLNPMPRRYARDRMLSYVRNCASGTTKPFMAEWDGDKTMKLKADSPSLEFVAALVQVRGSTERHKCSRRAPPLRPTCGFDDVWLSRVVTPALGRGSCRRVGVGSLRAPGPWCRHRLHGVRVLADSMRHPGPWCCVS